MTAPPFLARIPVELLEDILDIALSNNPTASHVLSACRAFADLGRRRLHSYLYFNSASQLARFGATHKPLVCAPKTLTVSLAGGAADFLVFAHLAAALRRCKLSAIASGEDRAPPGSPQVVLDALLLRLHSHRGNPRLQDIYNALSLASPIRFVWMGPDPAHHFSTAIVPEALTHLVRAIGSWSAVQHITLTNVAIMHDGPLLPNVPATLRTLYVGQATFLPPSAVAKMLCLPECASGRLEQVRLVDAYRHSIWGPRVRGADVEDAAMRLEGLDDGAREGLVQRVRRVVRCEKQTERIMGGDNGDEEGLLH